MKIGMQLSVGVPVFNSFAFFLIYFLKTNVITWPLRLAPPMSHGQYPLLSLLFRVLIPAWFLLTSVPWHKPVHVPATLSPPVFYQLTHSRPSDCHSLFFFLNLKKAFADSPESNAPIIGSHNSPIFL